MFTIPRQICSILFLISLTQTVDSKAKRPLNSFIRHFEGIQYDTSDVHRRSKRSLAISPVANLQIKFKAHDMPFHLHMTRNHDIFTSDFTVTDQSGNSLDYDHSRFFHGEVEGKANSYVLGKIHEGRFEGSIKLKDQDFFVEPAEKYFGDDHTEDFHSVVYSSRDLEYDLNHAEPMLPPRPVTLKGTRFENTENSEETDKNSIKEHVDSAPGDKYKDPKDKPHKRVRRGSKNKHRNTCNLKVVADHLFMQKFVRRETAIDQMVLHYQAVEYIFRNQTFNITKEFGVDFWPQGIGFRIKEVVVWADVSLVPKNLVPRYISVYRLLELFSRANHSTVCQAVLFTDRSFDNGVMGLSWIAYPYGQAGGVCDPYADYGGISKSYNTALVTFRMYRREAPPPVTEITLAHELGHAMGAQHDPETSTKCAPTDEQGGKYIMWDKSTSGHLVNNKKFSDCSINSMIKVINAKGLEADVGCFTQRYWAICGNGAHEEGEICDCGTVENCKERCCVPYGSKEGIACTLANEAYECSPSRGPCCLNKTCTLAREFEKCYDGEPCRKPGFCDGLHYWCPAIQFRPNGTLCDKDRSVCQDGYCQGSICSLYNLEPCLCDTFGRKCHVCCNYNGQCLSSYDIDIMPNRTKSRGTPCDNYKGYCDALGGCIGIDMDGPLRMLYVTFFTEEGIKIWFSKYWYVVILGSLLIMLMLAVFVYYCQDFTPSDNPVKEGKRHHKPLTRKRQQVQGGYGYATGGQPIPMQANPQQQFTYN